MNKNVLRYLIAGSVAILFALAIMASKDLLAQTDESVILQILSDAFFVPGVCFMGVGLIVVASRGGAFDMLGYAIRMMIDVFKRDVKDRKYKDFYEYRQAKKEKKRSIAYLLVVGCVMVIIAAFFLIAYSNV